VCENSRSGASNPGAEDRPHQDISMYLQEKRKSPPWWSQMVAFGYERQRGLREIHQTSGGDFAASASRTFNLPLAKLYEAWTDQKLRRGRLPDAKIEISTATTNQSVRAAWDVGKSRVGVYFYGKGEGKTQIAVDHLKLTSAKESARMKSNWREVLDRLQKWLPVHLERD
jgi:hypothetical protein